MSKSRRHGRRRGMSPDKCPSTGKTGYTTWDAAQSAMVRTPDAIRHYACNVCGYRHITRYEEEEYALRVAEKEYEGEGRTEQAAERRDATAAAFKRILEARPPTKEAAHAS